MAEGSNSKAVLRITVKNHPGAMSHICGLFSRRAFNMDALVCLPHVNLQVSSVWLLVARDARLNQMVRQLEKLEDVSRVVEDYAPDMFRRLSDLMHGDGML